MNPLARAHLCKPCIRAASRGAIPESPCAVCGSDELRVLAVVELDGARAVLCANHRALVGPGVCTVEALRAEAALAPVQGCARVPAGGGAGVVSTHL